MTTIFEHRGDYYATLGETCELTGKERVQLIASDSYLYQAPFGVYNYAAPELIARNTLPRVPDSAYLVL